MRTRQDIFSQIPGDAYAELGGAYAALAERGKTSASQGFERWREARSWYQKSLEIYRDLDAHIQQSNRYAQEIDEVTRGIKKCDQALAGL